MNTILKKNTYKWPKSCWRKKIDYLNKENFKEEIEKEAQDISKVRQCKVNLRMGISTRPRYMENVNHESMQCNNKDQSRMLLAKANKKNQRKDNLQWHYCSQPPEAQKHLLTECPVLQENAPQTEYRSLYDEDLSHLGKWPLTSSMATKKKNGGNNRNPANHRHETKANKGNHRSTSPTGPSIQIAARR